MVGGSTTVGLERLAAALVVVHEQHAGHGLADLAAAAARARLLTLTFLPMEIIINVIIVCKKNMFSVFG